MSLHEQVKEHYKKYGSGNFYKFKDGGNQVRILVEPKRYDSLFKGEPTDKFIAYAIVRDPVDGDIPAILNLPMSTINKLEELELSGKINTENYPLGFDIMIMKETSKSDKVTYMTMLLDPDQSMNLTSGQLEAVKKLKPIAEVAQALQKKQFENANKSLPSTHAPQLTENSEDALIRSNRNKAEMDPMFTAFENKINKAQDEESLDKVVAQIQSFVEDKTLPDFEADLLRQMVGTKKNKLVGNPSADINVDDIPF